MIEAIGLSDNIYATKTLLYVGFDNFKKLLEMFNIKTTIVPSSALGVDETSLLNLTAIYNTFASLGTFSDKMSLLVARGGFGLCFANGHLKRMMSEKYVSNKV